MLQTLGMVIDSCCIVTKNPPDLTCEPLDRKRMRLTGTIAKQGRLTAKHSVLLTTVSSQHPCDEGYRDIDARRVRALPGIGIRSRPAFQRRQPKGDPSRCRAGSEIQVVRNLNSFSLGQTVLLAVQAHALSPRKSLEATWKTFFDNHYPRLSEAAIVQSLRSPTICSELHPYSEPH